jgi:hypothetical protein
MVKIALTLLVRRTASFAALMRRRGDRSVTPVPYVADRAVLADATDLIARFGLDAAVEAASRADRSRDLGNVIHFCRWRQIERLVVLLTADEVIGSVH